MDAEEHDRALALTSHVPHLAAAALVAFLTHELIPLIASGFRDTTRIASGDPALWTGIFLQNRQAVLAGLDRLGVNLDHFRRALESSDRVALGRLLAQSKSMRDAINDSSLSVRHQALNDKSLERRA